MSGIAEGGRRPDWVPDTPQHLDFQSLLICHGQAQKCEHGTELKELSISVCKLVISKHRLFGWGEVMQIGFGERQSVFEIYNNRFVRDRHIRTNHTHEHVQTRIVLGKSGFISNLDWTSIIPRNVCTVYVPLESGNGCHSPRKGWMFMMFMSKTGIEPDCRGSLIRICVNVPKNPVRIYAESTLKHHHGQDNGRAEYE